MAEYYIDQANGNDTWSGEYATDQGSGTPNDGPWKTLTAVETASLSAGDRVRIRRDGNDISDAASFDPNDTGNWDDPIVIEGDMDDVWGDFTDINADYSITATLTFGSKTVEFSADVSAYISADEYIYETNEEPRDFAMRVESVSTSTVTLHMPYVGNETGSGKTIIHMGPNAIFGAKTSFSGHWNLDNNDNWDHAGIDLMHDNNSYLVRYKNGGVFRWRQCYFYVDGGTSDDVFTMDTPVAYSCYDCVMDMYNKWLHGGSQIYGSAHYERCKFYVDNASASLSFNGLNVHFEQCELNGIERIDHAAPAYRAYTQSSRLMTSEGTLEWDDVVAGIGAPSIHEDVDGTIGQNFIHQRIDSDNNTGLTTRHVGLYEVAAGGSHPTQRTGGSARLIRAHPGDTGTYYNESWDWTTWKLMDMYPIWLPDTAQRTFTFYCISDATANWTDDPTAAQFYIEAFYFKHATNTVRGYEKSTSVVDFNGSTSWQSISITLTPGQAGKAFFNVIYNKEIEASKTNEFYFEPVIWPS